MPLLFLFLDGVGIGPRDAASNPLVTSGLTLLDHFADGERDKPIPFGGKLAPLDATMGVEGRPQSATGQTALLTGLNAAKENGRHLFGFTNELLRGLLSEHSVLKRLRERGRRVVFANAFRPIFFLLPPAAQRRRLSATTAATLAAKIPLRTVAEIPIGEALYHDFTNRGLADEGHDLPIWTPQEAGAALGRLAGRYDFAMYEYFQTDKAGHNQDRARAEEVLGQLDRFLTALLETVDLERTTVLLASDHGNVEDLSHGGHTMNPALGLVWGRRSEWAASRMKSVMDVADVMLELASETESGGLGA